MGTALQDFESARDQTRKSCTMLEDAVTTIGAASLVLTTHESDERAIGATLKHLAGLSSVLEPPVLLRIGDFND